MMEISVDVVGVLGTYNTEKRRGVKQGEGGQQHLKFQRPKNKGLGFLEGKY